MRMVVARMGAHEDGSGEEGRGPLKHAALFLFLFCFFLLRP